ncbi:MAG: hypothetical protein LBU15_01875 [Rickettsiales bacterium]|jgi:MFS family permease|nr:hypothetical protein [Rickettsiales bacterium]
MTVNRKTLFLSKYFAIYFLHGFFFLKHYLIFLLNSELDPFDVGLIISTFNTVPLLLEIPTGAISDYFGSRNTLLLSMLLYLIGYVAIFFRKNFFTFCLFYGFYGLYETIFSGAKETLIYNNIVHLDMLDGFVIQRNRAKIVQYGALLLSSLWAGGMVVNRSSANYLIVLDALILSLYIAVVYSMEEHGNENLKKLNTNYLNSIVNGLRHMFRHSSLRKIIVFRFVWFSVYRIFLHYAPLFYIGIWRSAGVAGYMVPMEIFLAAVMQSLLIRFFTRRKNIYLDARLFLLSSFSALISSIIYRGLISYILIIIFFFSSQIGEVIFFVRMQRFIPAKSRAVILSASNFFISLLKLTMTLALGFISKKFSYRLAFIGMNGFFAIGAVLFYISILGDSHLGKIEKRLRPKNVSQAAG